MSIKLLDRGWRFSNAKGGDLLVLLGIADFANDEGIAYPSIPTLAKKARLTPRNAQRAIRRLIAAGELGIEEGKGPHRTHLYRIILSERAEIEGCRNVRVTKSQDDIRDGRRVTFQPSNPSEETVIKREILQSDNLSSSEQQAFEEFWKLYPARRGKKLEKNTALAKFKLLNHQDQQLVIAAARNYSTSEMVFKGIGIKDPHRFLQNGKGDQPWRDWITPEEKPKEHCNGTNQQRHSGFAHKDYTAGSF